MDKLSMILGAIMDSMKGDNAAQEHLRTHESKHQTYRKKRRLRKAEQKRRQRVHHLSMRKR